MCVCVPVRCICTCPIDVSRVPWHVWEETVGCARVNYKKPPHCTHPFEFATTLRTAAKIYRSSGRFGLFRSFLTQEQEPIISGGCSSCRMPTILILEHKFLFPQPYRNWTAFYVNLSNSCGFVPKESSMHITVTALHSVDIHTVATLHSRTRSRLFFGFDGSAPPVPFLIIATNSE